MVVDVVKQPLPTEERKSLDFLIRYRARLFSFYLFQNTCSLSL